MIGDVFLPEEKFTIHHSGIFSDVKYKSRSRFQNQGSHPLVVTITYALTHAASNTLKKTEVPTVQRTISEPQI